MCAIRIYGPALAAVCIVGFAISTLAADERSSPAPKGKGTAAAVEPQKSGKELSAEQQWQALEFARAQHPELANLLEKLREGNPKEYGAALQDLNREQQRLFRISDQNPERYSLEIALWKVESRIRLLTAQMVMQGDTTREESLKSLISERRNMKVQLVQFERGRAVERLASLDQQLEELQHDPDGNTEKELANLKQTVGKQAKATKTTKAKKKDKLPPSTDQKPKTKAKGKAKPSAESDSANSDAAKDQ